MAKKILEKVVETPAVFLEKTLDVSKNITQSIASQPSVRKVRHFWHGLGPGLTTGAADDDPSGIATYSQTGAQYGNQFLWLALFTFPLMAVVQEMCARIGLATGKGLAANINRHYPRLIVYLAALTLFAANSFNIGADLGAMAQATQLIAPAMPFWFLVLFFTLFSLLLQIYISYKQYAKYLKYLALILFAYVLTAFFIEGFNWRSILQAAFRPSFSFSKEQILLVTAVLGTTISPYLFFWQTSQEVEQEILEGKTTVAARRGVSDQQIKDMRIDVWSGMFISNLVMFFIIAVVAATLFSHGITNIATAADAAVALRPLAGDKAFLLFAFGIIGTGLLAVPVLAGSASYALSESFGWNQGLFRKLKEASAFYGVIIIAMIVGFIMNLVGIDPIKALIYSAIANGLVAPVMLFFIVQISSSRQIMGEKVNHKSTTALGWLVVLLMTLAGALTIGVLLG